MSSRPERSQLAAAAAPQPGGEFLVTKGHRLFVEFCDACRRDRYIGLCYGAPGVGKTLSARVYAHWERIEALEARLYDRSARLSEAPEILACRSVFYTAPVGATSQRIEREIQNQRQLFNGLLDEMDLLLHPVEPLPPPGPPDRVELILVDETDRLSAAGLEQLRDLYDRSQLGLVLIGMPGIEKRLARYAQLYSRVGFVPHFKALGPAEMHFVLQHKWQELGLSVDLTDFTYAEAVATITRITGGNFRLLQRLFSQIARVLQINDLHVVTAEVVETARQSLVIGIT
jgi:DNA transposition AAA+ family ATPase